MERPGFDQLFEETIQGRLQAMEDIRTDLKFRVSRFIAVAALVVLVAGYLLQVAGMLAFTVAVLAGYAWFRSDWLAYVARFKGEVIAEIVRFISPTLRYQPENTIPQATYTEAGIFPREPDRYGGEDYVSGTAGVTALRFSEVHSEYKTTDNGKTVWHTIFKGLFFEGDFNKHFSGRTYVVTDFTEKWLGALVGQALQGSFGGAGLVKLEDPVFEKEFAAYGTDQIEARYILTPALMTRIVEFRKKAGREVQLSFVGANIYVAISYPGNLFEPQLFSGVSREQIQRYHEALALAISIVQDLNLNTRIWTKA